MASRTDWLEALTKALLPRTPRVWIRRRRNRRMFEQYVRPTDVFLVGHPKSGNTWLAYMLAILLTKDQGSAVTLANIKDNVPPVHGKDHRIKEFSSLPNPRIFREEYPTHADLYPKTIYLLRDPRAVLVSLYHMYRIECNDPNMSIATFMDDYLTRRGCFQRWNRGLIRWDRQVQTWTEQAAHDPRIMIVRYEDMVQDRRGVLERVATFAGISYDANQMRLVHERSSFEAMQKDEEEHGAEAYPGKMAKRGRFIRRGETDGWKTEMDDLLARRIETEFVSTMKATGYLCRA
jgi:hypothetical protein